jgi:hypothetical protein
VSADLVSAESFRLWPLDTWGVPFDAPGTEAKNVPGDGPDEIWRGLPQGPRGVLQSAGYTDHHDSGNQREDGERRNDEQQRGDHSGLSTLSQWLAPLADGLVK